MVCGLGIVIICLISFTYGQTPDDNVNSNMDIKSSLHVRLSSLERRHNEGVQRVNELEKQQQTAQSHIVTLQRQQQIESRRIYDLEKRQQTNQRRIFLLKIQRKMDQDRILNLEKQRTYDQRRISDLEMQLQSSQRIPDLEKQQQSEQHRTSDLIKVFDPKIKRQSRQRLLSDASDATNYSQHSLMIGIYQHTKNLHSVSNNISSTASVRAATTKRTEDRNPERRNKLINQRQQQESGNEGTVAFHVVLSHWYNQMLDLMEIHFDKVTTNIGGSYSAHTGTFTCTRAGVYVFSWTVHVTTCYAYTELVKNGAVVGYAFSGNSQNSESGGNTVVIQLLQGDTVFVRVGEHPSGTALIGTRGTTTFSGFLLK
ncbi:myosin-4-like [Argopecten irradians]|uniref:myosin-4-like n=1 Tax=Argopecten irradians TaxID=31199 RepID=UPI0037110E96